MSIWRLKSTIWHWYLVIPCEAGLMFSRMWSMLWIVDWHIVLLLPLKIKSLSVCLLPVTWQLSVSHATETTGEKRKWLLYWGNLSYPENGWRSTGTHVATLIFCDKVTGHHPKPVGPAEMKVCATPQARSLAEVLGEDKVSTEYVVEEGHNNDWSHYMTSCGICRVVCFPSLLLCEYVCVCVYIG